MVETEDTSLKGTLGTVRSPAGPVGVGAVPMGLTRRVTKVIKDWEPPTPRTTPQITVSGATLADVAKQLNKMPEWGEGGGSLRADPIPAGTSPTVTVDLHANLVLRMPEWKEHSSASAAARKEWDRMFAKLKIHEERHVEIAIEESDKCAKALIGTDITKVASMVTNANRTMASRQRKLDKVTKHGSKAGVKFGDVFLDITIK